MRIRKRKVPLPLSLLSPIPISDPHLFSRSPVQEPLPPPSLLPPPSDHLGLTSSCASPSDLRRFIVGDTKTDVKEQLPCLGFVGKERKQEGNDACKIIVPAPAADDNRPAPTWSEVGDKVVPLKKRSRSGSLFETGNVSSKETHIMKSKMKENLLLLQTRQVENNHNHEHEHEHEYSNGDDDDSNNNNGGGNLKKGNKRRGSTIMEGSRCSRVNGRGWRCCQPTLVGYSLCEHHLGKGRLRSMTSVRGRSSKAVAPPAPQSSTTESEAVEAEEKQVTVSSVGKRVKLGVVKARSLSSLLGQSITKVAADNIGHHLAAAAAAAAGESFDNIGNIKDKEEEEEDD